MTENELKETLAFNIKKYRKDKFTQETLAEAIGVSSQNINDIEGKRRFPRSETLVKIADVLGVEVYQLFVPQDKNQIKIESTPENEKIKNQLQKELVQNMRQKINKFLDGIEKD